MSLPLVTNAMKHYWSVPLILHGKLILCVLCASVVACGKPLRVYVP
ncbi:hypothetical protein [Nostoc sp. 2RC]|nr:hypothetical protein [Nostoc sp. 2RC]MBC1236924.1 hypothetical protein [Nostoc sp. 2RC]